MKDIINKVSLKSLISKKDVYYIINHFIHTVDSNISIYDLEDHLLMGEGNVNSSIKYPIELMGYEIGWIKGEGEEKAVTDFLNYIVYSEYEKRALAREVMDKYREPACV